MKISKIITGLLIAISTTLIAQDKNSVTKIEEAYHNGRISYDESLQLKHHLLHDQRSLPDEYHATESVKCAFGINNELALQAKTKPLFKIARPASEFVYVHSFVSNGQTKTFQIYYDTTVVDGVPSTDANSNGIRDWVEETAFAFEKAYRVEVDTLGYREPLNFPIHGFYPVYINNQGSFYGGTTPDSQITPSPSTYTSFIEVDNDYIGNFFTHGYDALRVTCAHEFHHAVQLAYQNTYSSGDGWFYEVTSTWMEDVVYPEVNDYLNYLKYYFNQPHLALNYSNGAHEYAMCIWNHFIQKKFNRLIIRKVWENLPSISAINGWEKVLNDSTDMNLSETFREFVKWNFFTGYRTDTVNYYKEGYLYPLIKSQTTETLNDSLFFNGNINLSSSQWYKFLILNQTHAEIRFSGLPTNESFSVLVLKQTPGFEPVQYIFPLSSVVIIDNLLPSDTLTIAVVNKAWAGTMPFSFQYSIKPTINIREDIDLKVYPNPVISQTTPINFSFRLIHQRAVFYEIYSMSGKLIYRGKKTELLPGLYFDNNALNWNCRDMNGNSVPSGVYIYNFIYGKKATSGKIAVIR